MRFIFKTSVALVLVSALAFFFDPARGHRRRKEMPARALGSLDHARRHGRRYITHTFKTLRGRAFGLANVAPEDNPNPDDLTLRDRVESEVFRDNRPAKGHINISVLDGIVDLRGALATQDEIDALIRRVGEVRHVLGVRSYLHLPGETATNKVDIATTDPSASFQD